VIVPPMPPTDGGGKGRLAASPVIVPPMPPTDGGKFAA